MSRFIVGQTYYFIRHLARNCDGSTFWGVMPWPSHPILDTQIITAVCKSEHTVQIEEQSETSKGLAIEYVKKHFPDISTTITDSRTL